jgi:hypothetical protein
LITVRANRFKETLLELIILRSILLIKCMTHYQALSASVFVGPYLVCKPCRAPTIKLVSVKGLRRIWFFRRSQSHPRLRNICLRKLWDYQRPKSVAVSWSGRPTVANAPVGVDLPLFEPSAFLFESSPCRTKTLPGYSAETREAANKKPFS